ncbi:flagellar hook protein FlgE [Fontimonas sp. SYSU GA230001]|uniref:flagellar hook protein FlgE n=1 Tax=Fontimonas sp. SYSU GA230001 TaxID=3142450 RepID=UPI0032B3237C
MSFRISLSGLNAANSDLSVTANNIANVNTTGFKQSRAEFGDLYPISYFGVASNAIGAGVRLQRVAQQFVQGSINFTNNSLDLAITGNGFFTLSDNGTIVYTRAGAFGTDRQGYVVNATGQRLQVFPPVNNGASFDTARLTDLQISTADNPPQATSTIQTVLNLPANATPPTTAPFNSADPTSYNHTTSLTVFDSLGAAHTASLYYVKTANPNEWTLHAEIDGTAVTPVAGETITFTNTGTLATPPSGQIALSAFTPTNGAANITINLDLLQTTQYGASFGVASLIQDGYTTGRLTGLEITAEGVVQARYTNGQATPLGQIALSTFPNPQGLQQLGDTAWGDSFAAGQVIRGAAGSTNFGQIQSGALEGSNVDLTEQLVNMITAQRNFQANAQMISTADQVTQTIINIR